ncbi:uncharacterized protein LOC121262265 isoform X1 [Juglans microcarpa x Juglans regia]|uniref:uncharacterized protein LOC121262265 isoform X1 n=1 Tax=Juglans microcarpa x Juglans regia TaxID=2249226 RepID=UPI001B7DA05E|nr:uncharacterized protein LOC121262265 isoform X1 [Juglans microcarpa x Juglans regia]
MSMTHFAMVEELAFLVKDNLRSKHLVLSVEEALVNFLQDDTSSDGVLELEPMDAYSRLLLHRLAEIFGFSHSSVGEGDDRHLVLERCSDTTIPSILVSDILWQSEEHPSPMVSHQLLRKKEAFPVLTTEMPSLQHSFEERKAAYLVARDRIFSMNSGEVSEPVERKPRNVPVVARRMIAHALGHRINPCNQATNGECKEHSGQTDALDIQCREPKVSAVSSQKTDSPSGQNSNPHAKVKINDNISSGSSPSKSNMAPKQTDKICPHFKAAQNGSSGNGIDKDSLQREHLGAAKRMFAHALGLQAGKDGLISKGNEIK